MSNDLTVGSKFHRALTDDEMDHLREVERTKGGEIAFDALWDLLFREGDGRSHEETVASGEIMNQHDYAIPYEQNLELKRILCRGKRGLNIWSWFNYAPATFDHPWEQESVIQGPTIHEIRAVEQKALTEAAIEHGLYTPDAVQSPETLASNQAFLETWQRPQFLRLGSTRYRADRLLKNGHHYLLKPGVFAEVASGDRSLSDLQNIATNLRSDEMHVSTYEGSIRGTDEELGSELLGLVRSATYACLDGDVRAVGEGNRLGNIWRSPGYRYTRLGKVIHRPDVKLKAITPIDLLARLVAITGDPAIRSVEARKR